MRRVKDSAVLVVSGPLACTFAETIELTLCPRVVGEGSGIGVAVLLVLQRLCAGAGLVAGSCHVHDGGLLLLL